MNSQEYMTGNTMVAFPFKDSALRLCQIGQAYIATGSNATLPRDFLTDMILRIPIFYASYGDGMILRSIARAGSTYTFIFAKGVSALLVVPITVPIDGFADRDVVTYDTVDLDGRSISIAMVAGPAFPGYLAAIPDGTTADFGTTGLYLEDSVVEIQPEGITSLDVDGNVITGICRFVEGYNIELESTPKAGIADAELVLTANSGAGAGKYDNCAEILPAIDYIGTISGMTADADGNIMLSPGPDNCYRFVPGEHTITVYNDCPPPCEHTLLVPDLSLLEDRIRTLNMNIDSLVKGLNEDITNWNVTAKTKLCALKIDGYVTLGNIMEAVVYDEHGDPDPVETASIRTGKSPNYASIILMAYNRGGRTKPVQLKVTFMPDVDEGVQIVNSMYFDTDGQHLNGVSDTLLHSMPPNTYLKLIVMVRNTFPSRVLGTFKLTGTVLLPGEDYEYVEKLVYVEAAAP